MKRKIVTVLLALCLTFSLGACGGAEAPEESKQETTQKEEKEEPTNLTGIWQSENNEGAYQEAIIRDTTIEINWISEEDNSTSIYWIGTYAAPTETVEEYKWVSDRDKEKTDTALLASTDNTKEFTYKDGKISYSVSLMGTTTTLELTQTSKDVPELPTKEEPTGNNLSEDNSNYIPKDDFINKLNTLLTEYDLYTLEPGNSFEEDGKTFESYTILGTLDSSYLACATLPNETILTDILLVSNAGIYTYYYATNALLSIDENIDYESILSELSITEDGVCEDGIYTTTFNGVNIVHERADNEDTLSIMFY